MLLEFITGFGILLGYFAVCAAGALVFRQFAAVPREVFRKTLHIILLGSIFVMTYAFKTWWVSAAAAGVFIAVVFPILAFAERLPGYSDLLTERKHGEIKTSLIVVFGMFAVLICICWGWLREKYFIIASVFAWGLGDAAAALVGKRFGQHYIEGKLVEGRKSLEGTFAMFAVSFASVLVVLLANGSVEWFGCIPIAAATAVVCAIVELYTKGGMDTLTCPFSAAVIMIPLVRVWGGSDIVKSKAGERTLLASVVMSSPGPIVVGLGLLLGHSSTQLADFIRRTAELAAIIVSWILYRVLHKSGEPDAARKDKLERTASVCVGGAMCLSGAAMLFIALFSRDTEKGNVIPGLVIAVLGVTANTIFWLRYMRLNREKPEAILAIQSKLYRAKALVDVCVTTALAFVAVAPGAPAARYVDLVGSLIVSVYLVINGLMTIRHKSIDAQNISSEQ